MHCGERPERGHGAPGGECSVAQLPSAFVYPSGDDPTRLAISDARPPILSGPPHA